MSILYERTRFEPIKLRKVDEAERIKEYDEFLKRQGYPVSVDKMLLFWEHHFEAFETGYPNGYKKEGTIRYKQGMIRLPFGNKLLVYESKEFEEGKQPRGIATIESVVITRLKGLTEEEWLKDGFVSQEDLLEQMRGYYPDLSLYSWVSLYKFKKYNPKPSKKEIKKLLDIINK